MSKITFISRKKVDGSVSCNVLDTHLLTFSGTSVKKVWGVERIDLGKIIEIYDPINDQKYPFHFSPQVMSSNDIIGKRLIVTSLHGDTMMTSEIEHFIVEDGTFDPEATLPMESPLVKLYL